MIDDLSIPNESKAEVSRKSSQVSSPFEDIHFIANVPPHMPIFCIEGTNDASKEAAHSDVLLKRRRGKQASCRVLG